MFLGNRPYKEDYDASDLLRRALGDGKKQDKKVKEAKEGLHVRESPSLSLLPQGSSGVEITPHILLWLQAKEWAFHTLLQLLTEGQPRGNLTFQTFSNTFSTVVGRKDPVA